MRRYKNQGRVINPAAASAALTDALERVETNADEAWYAAAMAAVESVCRSMAQFTTDDVWGALWATEGPHEPRAMGAVMRRAARDKLCVASMEYRASGMPSCHKRPIRIWQSLLAQQVAA